MENSNMEYTSRGSSSGRSYDQSMGILNMDNMSTFGEFSSGGVSASSRVSDRLHRARLMALETLQKAQEQDEKFSRRSMDQSNKENTAANSESNAINSFVPFRQRNTINISDLVLEESINLENSERTCPPSAGKDMKISFEPAEITGRSTLHQRDFNVPSQQQQRQKSRGRDSSLMSVDEILASSFAPKARNLCETLRTGDISLSDSTMNGAPPEPRSRDVANASSSLLSSYNLSHSLPHTADMSAAFTKASSTKGSYASFRDADGFNFADEIASTSKAAVSMMEAGGGDDEDFAPGELMKSKLLMDEISWAQEYAAIPEAALSEDARALAKAAGPVVDKNSTRQPFETPSATNSMIAGDPNFSLGNYFQMRSEDIWNIARGPQSPDKCRTPIALVDSECEDNTVSTTSGFATPQVENKAYKKPDGNTVTICQGKKAAPTAKATAAGGANSNRDSKDSGMDTDSSYLLTISAIDRALCNLQVETDCSSGDLIDEIKRHAKRNPKTSAGGSSAGMPMTPSRLSGSSGKAAERMSAEFLAALIAENKENLDPHKLKSPQGGGHVGEDTVSFTESLLNSSTMKRLTAADGSPPQPRSPLSPISLPQEAKADEGGPGRLTVPQLKLTSAAVDDGGHDPDVDEWPSSPVVTPNRVRRHKSPSERLKHRTAPVEAPLPVTPVSSGESAGAAARRKAYSHTQPRSLCSTRLESAKSSDVASDFVVSPNMSKSSIHMRNATLTPTSGAAAAGNYGDASPFSSPRSYLSASGASSPHLDSTTNSERRQLAASGSGLLDGKSPVSSPILGDSSGGRHGGGAGAPSRSCSCNSMKSSISTATTTTTGSRSLSRCSNSSEFSHRDGKVIPLKVTMLELSWASTKLRTDSRKSMQVKNTANKRLIVRVQIHGPGYQILSHHGGVGNQPASTMLTLQSQECRSIVINFCPTVTGVAIGALAFYSPNSQTAGGGGATNNSAAGAPFLEIPLYGYGGHASVVPRNILKGPVGDAFLPIGDLYELAATPELERNFEIFNKGPLPGFAVVSVNSAGVNMPRLHDAFVVRPDRVLIPPGGVAVVRVSFRPKRDDMKKIMKKISHVLTLASMRVLCGDEANRQRMRQLVGRMAPNELAKITSAHSLESLWQQFPGEVALHELEPLGREKTDVTFDLLTSVRVHEISLTLNHDALDDTAAETTSLIFPDADETVLFRTVCASNDESPVPPYTERGHHNHDHHHGEHEHQKRCLETVTEMFERSSISSPRPMRAGDGGRPEVSSSSSRGSWSVSPKHLEFDFNSSRKCTECCTLYVRNDYASRLYFEAMCNYKGVVRCIPENGYVEGAGGEVAIQVETVLEKRLVALPGEPIKIIVKLDEERITVPIRVPRLEGRKP